MNKRILISAIAFFTVLSIALFYGDARAGTMATKKKAEAYALEIINMRSTLAKNLIKPGVEVTPETFKKVCGAVGKRVKEIAKKEGVIITHAAVKYRNPKNAATPFEARLMSRFDHDRNFKKFWGITFEGDETYNRLIMPIFVEKACLACHGAKEKRPAFIVKKYPGDKAYGFKEGDIRGLISIRVPEE